ncbi:aldo/keto reductase [Gloeobacter violaceus]|uniref:Glr1925 protein n=1 Tax=Gloeobacter violaceus (strain ATCC 29082 / PCC 7421) TaxID=251221 RepID=Q7NJA7_GLOVI|nr:aldo/keto reductase [Gloeobacter violaceus]BAC89866.1 glr1925 [Gloeobacter violaceus PCC 7421]
MQTVALTPSGPEVPQMGIGTWAWGDRLFWNYGSDYGPAEVRNAFEAAVSGGVPFFDTAELYGLGESETLLGRFERESGQTVQIATKYLPLPWRWGAEAVEEALSASLTRLGREQVELYQVHSPFNFFMGADTLMGALAREVKRGRIAAVGVSNYSASQMEEAHGRLAAQGVPLAVNQVRYSLLTREIETNGVLDTARRLGVKILAYSPLAQGLLTGKYTADSPPEGARRLDNRYSPSGLAAIAPVLEVLRDLGRKHDRTPAQVALNWLVAQEGVIPIPGAKTAAQAEQNLGAVGWSLAPEEVERLSEVSRPWRAA